jgi:hypothetical protein
LAGDPRGHCQQEKQHQFHTHHHRNP